MKFSVENQDKYAVITAEVEKLDSLSAPDLKSELLYIIKSGKDNIIVDLHKSRYCDSSGLSALLTGNRLCKEADGTFVVCGLQPAVEKLVSISQLTSVFNITKDKEEAADLVSVNKV